LRLTVVIPTYNESENLPQITTTLIGLPVPDLRLIVVDDNSPDGTGEIADRLSEQYPGRVTVLHRSGKQGLGTAYIQGFKKALDEGADCVAQMDADFSHDPGKLIDLLDALQDGEVVVGSRYTSGGQLDQRWPLWRKWLSGFGNFYARTILHLPIKDATGGFRLWRRDVLLGMPLDRIRSNGYAFQVETAYVAHRLGYTFKEVPIYFADRRLGDSKMSLRIQIEAAFRVWQFIFMYRDLKP
jgi:dolichol-phosphate mannosyltransferase